MKYAHANQETDRQVSNVPNRLHLKDLPQKPMPHPTQYIKDGAFIQDFRFGS
jgi:hypothetical protein